MLDLGLIDHENLEKYNSKYLNELTPGDKIHGEIVIREFKNISMENKSLTEFYVIITDRESHIKWICDFITFYNLESDVLYSKHGDLFYSFFDSLNHVVNKKPLNWRENYSVNFNRFRNTINQFISGITVKTVESDVETVNLEVIEAEVISVSPQRSPITIYGLAQENPVILMVYAKLRNKGDRITIKNIQFELKSSFDDGTITETAYRNALEELKKVKPSVDIQ